MTDHVDETAWEQLMSGELAPDARAAALRHVTTCRECAAIYKGLLALERDAQAAGLIDVAPPARSRRSLWIGGAAVLAAAAALLLWWQQKPRGAPRDDVHRGGGEVVHLERSDPDALRWQTIDGAESYAVSVFTEDGTLVWDTEVAGPPAAMPDVPHGHYRWRVEARTRGLTIASSALGEVDVR